jgi:GntR family transcriptional repressor for pyruvate dehydrogenase complex
MTGLTNYDEVPFGVPQIVAAIEDEIVTSRWPERTKLPSERTLAERFGVSRPVVREALRALNERGLITVSAGRGSFVRPVQPVSDGTSAELLARRGKVTARDLVVARTMLESEAAALAATNRTDEQLEQMRDLLDRFAHSVVPASADLDLAFHEAIAVASGNPVIQVMFGSIRALTHGIMLRSLSDRLVTGKAVPLHNVILHAIAEQDPVRARAGMAEHIDAARQFYGADLDQPLADVLRRRAELTPALGAVLRDLSQFIDPESDSSQRS